MNYEMFEELLKEQDENEPMPWKAYENADERSLMLEALIARYNDVMDYCGESEKALYKPLERYLCRVFGTLDEMYSFCALDEPPAIDEEELKRHYERYYMHNVKEVEEMQNDERVSL